MIGNSPSCATSNGGLRKIVDVSSLFVGVESLFPEVIDSLYAGKLAYPANFNQTLKNVYDSLELKVRLLMAYAAFSVCYLHSMTSYLAHFLLMVVQQSYVPDVMGLVADWRTIISSQKSYFS